MRVVGIDPGLTTGLACVVGNVIVCTYAEQPDTLWDTLYALLTGERPDGIVIETFPLNPTGALHTTLREVVQGIEDACAAYGVEPVHVTPGVWKTSSIPATPTTFNGKRLSTHERDAVRMARWYIRREQRANA